MSSPEAALIRLQTVLRDCQPAALAVSGGVDSMTLAVVAGRAFGAAVTIFHALSPAVPAAASARVRAYAASEAWQLRIIDAGEFGDRRYLDNPADRCFYCKSNLYGSIARHTTDQILSGTNLDDLDDWRPGLRAARNESVRHPFVEAGIDKGTVRALARALTLTDIAELPGAPCLSSRVETGLPIAVPELRFIDAAEQLLRHALAPQTVRCRVRRSGIVIELDAATLNAIAAGQRTSLTAALRELAEQHAVAGSITFSTYARGSAFLRATL